MHYNYKCDCDFYDENNDQKDTKYNYDIVELLFLHLYSFKFKEIVKYTYLPYRYIVWPSVSIENYLEIHGCSPEKRNIWQRVFVC